MRVWNFNILIFQFFNLIFEKNENRAWHFNILIL